MPRRSLSWRSLLVGLILLQLALPCLADPLWTFETELDDFGWQVERAGDVDGDGAEDILAFRYDYSDVGYLYLFLGECDGTFGWEWASRIEIAPVHSWTRDAIKFGGADLDGNGYSDVVGDADVDVWVNGGQR